MSPPSGLNSPTAQPDTTETQRFLRKIGKTSPIKGFLGLCAPTDVGGLGGDFVAYALVSEEIGRHCATTALTFNMHTATALLADG